MPPYIGNQDVSFIVQRFENGSLAMTTVGNKKYLLAAYGRDVTLGLLRVRLIALSQYFCRLFDQLK